MAHAYKRHGVWYIKHKDIDGVWKRKSCGKDATQKDAVYLAKEYSSRELNNFHKVPVRVAVYGFDSVIDCFIKVIEAESKTINSIQREKTMLLHMKEYGLLMKAQRIADFDPQAYLTHRSQQGMSPKTVLDESRIVKRLFRFCLEKHFMFENPCKNLQIPKQIQRIPSFYTEDELQRIFNAADERVRDILRFLYYSGLRSGELANLEYTDFNEATGQLKIRVVDGDKRTGAPGNKTKRECVIPLNDKAIEIIKRRSKHNPSSSKYIFLNKLGEQYRNNQMIADLRPVLRETKIKGNLHKFRHTTASHMVIKGVSLYHVRDLLRHKDFAETQVYAHLSKEALSTAINVL